jgi:transposase-like protein
MGCGAAPLLIKMIQLYMVLKSPQQKFKILPSITEWHNRPLASVYPIIFLNAMYCKVRVNGKVATKAFYSVLAVRK